MRHTLDRRRTGADDADALACQVLQVFTGVVIVPPAGVERMPAKRIQAGDAGKLGLRLIAVGHRDKPCAYLIAPVRPDYPAGMRFIPTYLMHVGLQARIAV